MIVNNIFLFQKFYTVKISIRNYTELSVVKYFPEKNDPTISKQLKNILLKFPISKTFRAIRIKLEVVNIKLTMGKFPIYNIHTTQQVPGKLYSGKFPPGKFPTIKLTPGKVPPGKLLPRKIPSEIFPPCF